MVQSYVEVTRFAYSFFEYMAPRMVRSHEHHAEAGPLATGIVLDPLGKISSELYPHLGHLHKTVSLAFSRLSGRLFDRLYVV